MHITAMEEYGLRCLLQLARMGERGPVSASEVSEKEGISVQYVSKLMHLFRKAGLVSAHRGVQGGFSLSRPAETILLFEIFESLTNKRELEGNFCNHFRGNHSTCVHVQECSVRPVWRVISGYFEDVLRQVSLRDLVVSEEVSRKKVEAIAGRAVAELKGRISLEKSEERSGHGVV